METAAGDWAWQLSMHRHHVRLTQTEVADAVGVTQQAVAKWEAGGNIPLEKRLKLAALFGVDSDDLFPEES